MNWSPPDTRTILEDRLARAMDELAEDTRLHMSDAEPLPAPAFACRLVEEKFTHAAARAFETAEATLRHSATDHLVALGLPLDTVRHRVGEAGEAFRHPAPPRRWPVSDWAAAPWIFAGVAFALWTFAAIGLWLAYAFTPLLLPVLVLAGIFPAALVLKLHARGARALLLRIIGEYPPALHRHYLQQYELHLEEYRAAIKQAESEVPANAVALT